MRAWIASELRPHATGWEQAGTFPDSVFVGLAEQGWLGLKYGPQADWVADAVLCEELARCGSGGLAAGIGAHVGIATPPIARFGTGWQRARWLDPAIRGESIGALAITEPGAGSDVASLRTRAVAVDGGWLVSGAETFITNGIRASFYVTAVRTGGPGHGGISSSSNLETASTRRRCASSAGGPPTLRSWPSTRSSSQRSTCSGSAIAASR
jgi:acyl-CoA dehydrogenase